MFLWRQITPVQLAAGLKALAGRTQAAIAEAEPVGTRTPTAKIVPPRQPAE
jgi:hypothetical protein